MSTFETPVRPDVQVPRGDILAALRAPPPSAVRAATPPHRPTKAQELELEQERQAQALRELDALRLVFRGAHHRRGAFDEEEAQPEEEAGWADLSVEPTWRLRERMTAEAAELGVRAVFPSPAYCADNAAMIAGLGHHLLHAGRTADWTADASPR